MSCIRPLEHLGYENRGVDGIEGRPYFKKPQAVHVHMYPAGQRDTGRLLRFRDYLLSYPTEAARYEALKQELAQQFATARRAYVMAKDNFCAQIDQLALEASEKAPGDME